MFIQLIKHRAAATLGAAIMVAGLMGSGSVRAEGGTPRPADAKLYFVNIKDGDTVTSPFVVKFGLDGMKVSPAGVAGVPDSGHHHLLIDTDMMPDELKRPIQVDDKHVHFGKGQTETTLTLPPGAHSLRLVLADANHIPHDPPLRSEPITIIVK